MDGPVILRSPRDSSPADHVANKWLGHSGKVAEKHYLQVTDDHWTKALQPAPAVAPIATPTGSISSINETKNPCVLQGSDGDWGVMMP